VMSAAVADYTPKTVADQKIKKAEPYLTLELVKTTDILASLGKSNGGDEILVGLALETQDEQANAFDKLQRKNLDFIVLNSMRDAGAGFAGDRNKVTLIDRNGDVETFDLKSKAEVANDICSRTLGLLNSLNQVNP